MIKVYFDVFQSARNEELSMELLNLVNAKAALMRQWEGRDMSFEAAQEVERIKAIVSRLNSRRVSIFLIEDFALGRLGLILLHVAKNALHLVF